MNDKNIFFLKQLIDLLSVCLYWKDTEFRYLGCNLAQIKSLGFKSENEMLGKTDNQLYPKSIADKLKKIDLHVSKLGAPIEVEETRLTTNGETIVFLSRKVPIFDEKKNFKGIASISVNITELDKSIQKPKKPTKIKLRSKSKKNPILAKILLVEDAPLAQQMTAALFTSLQCSVDVTNGVKDALKYFRQTHYDLIIADLSLQDGDGIALAKDIRSHEKQRNLKATPLIGLTAHANDTTKKMCYEAQFNELLIKPLLKKQAEHLLTTYVSHYTISTANAKPFNPSPITDDIIDIDDLDKIIEDEFIDPLTIIFPVTIDTLNIEKPKLESAYLKNNWAAVKFVIHKLRGTAAYCAAKRLEKVCEQFGNYFETHLNPQKKETDILYRHLLTEIKALEKKLLSLKAKNE